MGEDPIRAANADLAIAALDLRPFERREMAPELEVFDREQPGLALDALERADSGLFVHLAGGDVTWMDRLRDAALFP